MRGTGLLGLPRAGLRWLCRTVDDYLAAPAVSGGKAFRHYAANHTTPPPCTHLDMAAGSAGRETPRNPPSKEV